MTLSPKTHQIYSAVTGFAAVTAGICLIIACIGIWGAGTAPFSPESVTAAFAPISIPVYLCLALMLSGMVLDAVSPAAKAVSSASRQIPALLRKHWENADLSICGPVLRKDIGKLERKLRRCAFWKAVILCLLAIIFLGYCALPGVFFVEDPTGCVMRAMAVLIPCLVAAFVSCLLLRRQQRRAMAALILLLKQAPRCARNSKHPNAPSNWIPVMQAIICIAAVALIFCGAVSGGTADVLAKAVNICTECVGLG